MNRNESQTETPAAQFFLAEIERLEARRRRLSFQVGQGNEAAEAELDQVEDALGRLKRDQERAALAQEERVLRAEEAAREAAEAERQERADRFKARLAEQLVAAGKVEMAVEQLELVLTDYLAIGRECYLLSNGRTSRSGERQVRAFLAWRLGLIMPNLAGSKPSHELRVPLAEALRGAPEAE